MLVDILLGRPGRKLCETSPRNSNVKTVIIRIATVILTTLWGRCTHNPHFIDEAVEALREETVYRKGMQVLNNRAGL